MLPMCWILSEYFGFIALSSDSRTNDAFSRIFNPTLGLQRFASILQSFKRMLGRMHFFSLVLELVHGIVAYTHTRRVQGQVLRVNRCLTLLALQWMY